MVQNKGRINRKGKIGKVLKEMPDLMTPVTKATEERLGPFAYGMVFSPRS